MSSSHLRRHSKGEKPQVVGGVAEVKLDPSGSAVERLDSDYKRPLPVGVKVTYKLNGKPIAASDIADKSGAVEIDYHLTNTTPKPVSVCFVGFNGKLIKKTVVAPSPILAYLSLTVPKNVAKFTAPGAFYNADRTGVNPQWLVELFKPLGSTQESLVFTMDTSKAEVPKATLLLETLNPFSISGQAPAKSAAAVARAQAEVSTAATKVQSDVAALELKASGSHRTSGHGHSHGRSRSGSHGSGAGSSRSGASHNTSPGFSPPSLSFGTSPGVLSQMRTQIGALGQSILTSIRKVGASTGTLSTRTDQAIGRLTSGARGSIDNLGRSTNRTIDAVAVSTNHSIRHETHRMSQSLDVLAADLHRSIARPSLNRASANATRLQRIATLLDDHAGALGGIVTRLRTGVSDLVAALPASVQDALLVRHSFRRIERDLDAVKVAHRTGAAYLRLVGDLHDGQRLARTVSDSLSQLEMLGENLAGEIHTVKDDVASLQGKITALIAASTANVESTAKATLSRGIHSLSASFTAAVTDANGALSGISAEAHDQIAATDAVARRRIGHLSATTDHDVARTADQVRRAIAGNLASARAIVASVQHKINTLLASAQAKADAALAAAEQKAKQGGEESLAAAQTAAGQVVAKAQHAFAIANNDYAALLAINQQALANELPGGDATSVTEQDGSLIYTIGGS
jgi:hypothetical protein